MGWIYTTNNGDCHSVLDVCREVDAVYATAQAHAADAEQAQVRAQAEHDDATKALKRVEADVARCRTLADSARAVLDRDPGAAGVIGQLVEPATQFVAAANTRLAAADQALAAAKATKTAADAQLATARAAVTALAGHKRMVEAVAATGNKASSNTNVYKAS